MPIYLSEYIGSGTQADPFRPRGSDQPGWAAIDLRPDGGGTLDGNGLNRCFLHLPTHDNDPRLYQLAAAKGEDTTLTIRAGLAARLNATITYTRIDDLIAELMLRPPARAWKPLRDRPTQQLAVHLGGLLSPRPAVRTLAAQAYNETWSTADNASLTSDLTWTEYLGTGLALVSNRCQVAGVVSQGEARAEHALDTDDLLVRMTLNAWTHPGGSLALGVLGRKDTSATQTHYSYTCQENVAGGSYHRLAKWISTAETTLGSDDPTDFAAGELLELSIIGSSITGVRNGTISVGPVTDTAIASGRYAGVRGYSDHASGVANGDNWSAQDFVPRPLVTVMSPLRW